MRFGCRLTIGMRIVHKGLGTAALAGAVWFAQGVAVGSMAWANLLEGNVKEVTVTNTVALPPERRFDRLKVLSIAGLLAKAIGYTHSDQSVSSLFD